MAETRVHLNAGTVWLRGYVNVEPPAPDVDVRGAGDPEPSDGLDAAYVGTAARRRNGVRPVVEMREDWVRRSCFPACSVAEIVCRQGFDRYSVGEAAAALEAIDYMAAPGARLTLEILDAECLALAGVNGPPVLGGQPVAVWELAAFAALLRAHGFTIDEARPEPLPPLNGGRRMIVCRKPTIATIDPLAWQRIVTPKEIPADWVCGEVGPGSRWFWPRASVVVDVVERGADDLPPGATFHLGDICQRTPIADQALDLVLCSHVLEHVEDPVAAAAELSRIAKRGVIECPHPFKEFLFAFEETDHRWWVWPAGPDGALVFQRPDARIVSGWRDAGWSTAVHQILRMGPHYFGSTGRHMRDRYVAGQFAWLLNVVHRWEGALKVKVVDAGWAPA